MSKRPENPYKGHPVLGIRPTKPLTREEALKVIDALYEFHGISEKDPAALGKLAIFLAHLFVPALRPQKSRRRPPIHSAHDIAFVHSEYVRVKHETGLSNTDTIIKKMAEDKFWQDPVGGFGKNKKETVETLRYILTDRIKQPEIKLAVLKDIRETLARLEKLFPELKLTKKSQVD